MAGDVEPSPLTLAPASSARLRVEHGRSVRGHARDRVLPDPWLGLDGILRALGVVNLAAGAAFALLGLRRREIAELDPGAAPRRRAVTYGAAALLVGFAMMVLQTIAIRVGGLALGASEYTFTMVVAVFVLCIAIGSLAVSALRASALRAARGALGARALGSRCTSRSRRRRTGRISCASCSATRLAFYPYYAAVFIAILLAIGPAVVLSGAVLPLLFHALRREVGGSARRRGAVQRERGRLAARRADRRIRAAVLARAASGVSHRVGAVVLAAALVTLREYPRIRFAGARAAAARVVRGRAPSAVARRYLMAGTFRFRQPTDWTFAGRPR